MLHGILMLNLSIDKHIQGQTYSNRLALDTSWRYHCPYDLIDNKVNAIYIVYKIRDSDTSGTEHNYLYSCGMGDDHRGVCFLKDKRTMYMCS